MITKLLLLASLIPTRPTEFVERLATILETRLDRWLVRPHRYADSTVDEALAVVGEYFASPAEEFLAEAGLNEIESRVRQRIEQMPAARPFALTHNADFALARFCYVVARMLKPEVVVETGVAYGVTSAFILKALAVNGGGSLHSVDLPPLGRDAHEFVGVLVPNDLRERWHLHRGTSKRILPRLLPAIAPVGMFVHDSLHTYRTMTWEFQTVAPYLASPATVIADDIGGNSAFHDWANGRRDAVTVTVNEATKRSQFGVAACGKALSPRPS